MQCNKIITLILKIASKLWLWLIQLARRIGSTQYRVNGCHNKLIDRLHAKCMGSSKPFTMQSLLMLLDNLFLNEDNHLPEDH